MNSFLLQISTTATDSLNNVATAAATVDPELSLIDLLFKGGWVMIPILILSIISIYIMAERYVAIKRASQNPDSFMNQVKGLILRHDLQGALLLCGQTRTPIARMIEKGIKRIGQPLKDIETSIENVGKLEVTKLEKNISILGIIAGIAPMLGFIGTIIGVIKIFYAISASGDFGIAQISGGLYTKMVTSAAGLIVGIIAHVGYHYLSLMVDRVVFKMENNAIEFTDLLQEN
ncbi:MotA/TolQ/ExbB proton channel family protein [Adhaeribacter radiodurans]|uniref:MotA/TolQ/ExbB proton channel family protein n=1 Tax=Adhaeribacter radiodurans TaxID=2745197 RepID=A0A7L7L6G3_9BACT|nr:MotA/TolQ/ExbB proton channel family protein [Adhaeribacter radiodurans]QMU28422.1 MotA/TolQ/ExbB proton channel family protein [Adhaeribacter radiodurans]